MKSTWVARIGIVLLCLAVYGLGGAPFATAAKPVSEDPHAGLPQNWDQTLPAATRFVVLSDFANAAVRDNETGLVWEKSPDVTDAMWTDAALICVTKNVGGRKGWRLPSIPELASLIDPTVASPGPTLPAGHPFTNVQSSPSKGYWSATRNATISYLVWHVFFDNGAVTGNANTVTDYVWCVRGPMNTDQY